MQRHLEALQSYIEPRDLIGNLGKTKVVIFNTTPQCVHRFTPQFTYGKAIVKYITSNGPDFCPKGGNGCEIDTRVCSSPTGVALGDEIWRV